MPFACIFVPNFPVAALFRSDPELRMRPVALYAGKPPLEKIFAVSESAKRLGIAPGMTKAQAELCSELTLRPRSLLQESAAHAALLDCAQSFSPSVEDAAPDTTILDLAGMKSLLGSLPKIADNLFRRAANLGLDVNVAVASNPDAAVLAARGFSGVTVIPLGKEAECLAPLPLKVLFSEHEEKKTADNQKEFARLRETSLLEFTFLETLDRWGVRDLGALATLPEVALSERLGQKGLRLQQLARGSVSRTLVPVEAPVVFEEAVELEYPIILLEPLAFLLNRMLEQICARLASRALHTQELRLTLGLQRLELQGLELQRLELQNLTGCDRRLDASESCGGSDCYSSSSSRSAVQKFISERPARQNKFCRTLTLPLPMLDAKLFLKLLQLDLNANPPGAPIIKIHLSAKSTRPRSAQGGLFLPPSPEPEKLELTLARIANIVGESCVGSLELLDTHRAESFRMRRFVSGKTPERTVQEKRKAREPAPAEPTETVNAIAALRRFRPPLRVTVTLEKGVPARIVCAKKKEVQGSILWKAGPWRSSGDWWDKEAWARDEWEIALQNGEDVALYRLAHDLLGGGWFVEGTYD